MKVIFEGNKIKIRREEGVVLVIDSDVPLYLYDIVRNLAIDMDIPFKLAVLSRSGEITDKNAIGNLKQLLRNRGRFITPLIENFFQQLPRKKYDLIILHSGRIYDLDDYENELSAMFREVLIQDINLTKNFTETDWIALFKSKIFNFSIRKLELFFNSAIPYERDKDFSISLDTSKKQLIMTKTFDSKVRLDIYLKTCGKEEETNIQIKVNNIDHSIKIKNDKTFPNLNWKSLSEKDFSNFKLHLGNYKKSNFNNILCPKCNKEHKFEKPFFCSKQRPDILRGGFGLGTVILDDISNYYEGFVLFLNEANSVKYIVFSEDLLEFDDLRFIFISRSEKKVYEIKCGSDSLDITEGKQICNDLYEIGENIIVYLI